MTLSKATRKRINELCKVNNMNINQLAIASGINPSTIRSTFKVIKKLLLLIQFTTYVLVLKIL